MEEQALRASQDDLLKELVQLSREYQSEPRSGMLQMHFFPTLAEAREYSERLLHPVLSSPILTDMLGP